MAYTGTGLLRVIGIALLALLHACSA